MAAKAEIRIKRIEEDGTITLETDRIPAEQHLNAEAFMKYLSRLLGGTVTTTKLKDVHIHDHQHQSSTVEQQVSSKQ